MQPPQMGVQASLIMLALIAFVSGYTTAFVELSFPVLVPFTQHAELRAYYVMLGLAR